MDIVMLLRRTCRTAKPIAASFFFLIGAGLGGCTAVPPEYSPIEWAQGAKREVQSWFGQVPDKPTPAVDPPPAEGRPFPNLATVPPPPPRDTPEKRAERQRQLDALMAARNESVAADTGLRTEGKFPEEALPPVPTQAGVPEQPGGAPQPSRLERALREVSPTLGTPASPERIARGAETAPPPSPFAAAVPPVAPPVAPSPGVLTTSERRGAVSFGRDAAVPTDASRTVLQDAAAYAVANSGRVRLVPAQYGREPLSPREAQARSDALRRAFAAAALPAERVVIGEGGGQRVDLYDVYVDY
jgi:hypothetical protein